MNWIPQMAFLSHTVDTVYWYDIIQGKEYSLDHAMAILEIRRTAFRVTHAADKIGYRILNTITYTVTLLDHNNESTTGYGGSLTSAVEDAIESWMEYKASIDFNKAPSFTLKEIQISP